MVLEEATNPSADRSFSHDASDPSYGRDSGIRAGTGTLDARNDAKIRYNVPWSSLPRPFGPFGRITWTPSSHQARTIEEGLGSAASVIGRPLNQEEVDAFSEHYAQAMRSSSHRLPVALVSGALSTWRGREKYTLPGVEDLREKVDVNKFGPLKGERAQRLWHAVRFNAWFFAWGISASLVFGSLSATQSAAHIAADDRLKAYKAALMAKVEQRRETVTQQPPRQAPIESQDGRMDDQVRKAQAWQRPQPSSVGDDMSPTGGAFMEDLAPAPDDGGLLSDRQREMNEKRDAWEQRSVDRIAAVDAAREQRSRRMGNAKPQTGYDTPGSESQPAGSRWERLRSEAKAGAAGGNAGGRARRVPGEQQEGSTVGDSFTFSHSEEDRQLAQQEAQRDFDAQVEKERRGLDFNEGNRGRRW